MPKYCPECGDVMRYERCQKIYVCEGCGLTISLEEYFETIKSLIARGEEPDVDERKEYLKWWLSRKK